MKIYIFKEGIPIKIVQRNEDLGYQEKLVDHVTYISVRPRDFIEGKKNYIAMEKEDEVHKDPSKLFEKIVECSRKMNIEPDKINLIFGIPAYYAPHPEDEERYWISPEGYSALPLDDIEVKYFKEAFKNFLGKFRKG